MESNQASHSLPCGPSDEYIPTTLTLDKLDLKNIAAKLATHKGWNIQYAEEACLLYKRYLFLQYKYGGMHILAPSHDMDIVWHMHILDTKQYQADCQAIFERYLHHRPAYKSNSSFLLETKQAYQKTQELYFQEFKDHIYNVRFPRIVGLLISPLTVLRTKMKFFSYFMVKGLKFFTVVTSRRAKHENVNVTFN